MATVLIVLTRLGSAVFLALGLWLIADPYAVERLYPVTLNDAMAVSEMRAVFGGLMAGIGAAVLWLDLMSGRRREAAAVMATVFGGLLLARVAGLLGEGVPSGPVLNETVFETVMFLGFVVSGAYSRSR